MMRSKIATGSGTGPGNWRRFQNSITAFIDGSAVYGSDEYRADWLRTFAGGKMKVSEGNKLPWNTLDGEFNSNIDPSAPAMADDVGTNFKLYVAGDVRANENPLLLTASHAFC